MNSQANDIPQDGRQLTKGVNGLKKKVTTTLSFLQKAAVKIDPLSLWNWIKFYFWSFIDLYLLWQWKLKEVVYKHVAIGPLIVKPYFDEGRVIDIILLQAWGNKTKTWKNQKNNANAGDEKVFWGRSNDFECVWARRIPFRNQESRSEAFVNGWWKMGE